jgi:hypothetical protein
MKFELALGCWVAALAGCGEGNPLPRPADMAIAHDFATMPDLSTVNDLAMPTGDMAKPNGDVTTAHGMVYKYVVNSVTAPEQRSDFAIDLNGDGKTDNQLGSIVSALAAQGTDPGTSIAASVTQGQTIYLISVQTADPMLMNDDTVGVDYFPGLTHVNPDFSGNGSFTVDGKKPNAKLFGRLVNSAFSSNDPVTTTHPVTMTLNLALFPGGMPVAFPLNGAHIQFTTGTDAGSGAPGLLKGQINGSIKNSDVQNNVIPAIADVLNQEIVIDPNSQQAMQILQIFDFGGCTNPDGTMAMAGDGKIDICEVATNPIVMNILAPDVQIFDQNGNYAPNPKNANKDSLSVGLGFTAVGATF